jgi:hypothetical protein
MEMFPWYLYSLFFAVFGFLIGHYGTKIIICLIDRKKKRNTNV